MTLAAAGFLSPGRRGPSPSPTPRHTAQWMHTGPRSDVQRTHSYEPTRMVSAGASSAGVNQGQSYQPPVEPPATARPTWNTEQVRAAPVPHQQRPSGHAGHPPAAHPGGPQGHLLQGGHGSATALHHNHPRRSVEHPHPPPTFAFSAQGTQVPASSGPMQSPGLPDDRAPRSLGGGSISKSIDVTEVPHRTSCSSAQLNDLDADMIKDMKEKVDKMDAKMDLMGTKEDYERVKQDLVSEKHQSAELRTKIHELTNEAKQMQRITEAERERQSTNFSKKDMDLSDMEQKCADLQVDLQRRDEEVNQLKEKVIEQDKEKESLNHLQSEHNTKVSDYIDKMVNQHNAKVEQIQTLEATQQEKDQKIRELTSQLKDEKQKKDGEIAKRRIIEQQMKDTRAQCTTLEEQINDLKRVNEDLSKARDQATKSARAEQSKLKVLDEQKRECQTLWERERAQAAEEKRQLESNNTRLQERLKEEIMGHEHAKEEHANDVSQAQRQGNEKTRDLQNRLLEAQGQVEALSSTIADNTAAKSRAEQLLAEERQEFQINKVRIDDLKKQLERVDKDQSRKMSAENDKENQRLHEAVKYQKATIWDLESQLRQERSACALLSPMEAARILKVRDDTLIQDNNSLNIELCLVKDELHRIKGGPKSQLPQLEMRQQQPLAEANSIISTPGNRNSQ